MLRKRTDGAFTDIRVFYRRRWRAVACRSLMRRVYDVLSLEKQLSGDDMNLLSFICRLAMPMPLDGRG